ncbi:MAG TPA: hypothetical protein VN634_18695 [Candidatus Limnocylindrales bacterium]|nr:hypothetical protein [Candidatus Limnocylindrales bacterium]
MRIAGIAFACFAISVAAAHAGDEPRTDAQKTALAKYVGSYELAKFLKDPLVARELKHVVGAELKHLENNLSVMGPIALTGGTLSTDGNAPHMGGEENAVLCVDAGRNTVNAAMLSGGKVRVYSRQSSFDALPACIKEWSAKWAKKPGDVVMVTAKK